MNSSLLTSPCPSPAMFTTNKRLLQTEMRVLLLRSVESWVGIQILWDTFRSQIAELWFPYDRTIAIDRKRSQTIAEDRTWFYLLRSSAIVCDHDRRIADDRRSVFPYDRRRSQNFLRSAIRDPRSSAIIWKPALSYGSSFFPLRFLARALPAWAINRGGKNSVRNLRYGPRTRLVRGISTAPFSVERGVRQGDPLSPYLFIIVIETLCISIRRSKDIQGITVDWGCLLMI